MFLFFIRTSSCGQHWCTLFLFFIICHQGALFVRASIRVCCTLMLCPVLPQEDPLVLNEYRDDLRSECEKFGEVKKVIIFDVSSRYCCTH